MRNPKAFALYVAALSLGMMAGRQPSAMVQNGSDVRVSNGYIPPSRQGRGYGRFSREEIPELTRFYRESMARNRNVAKRYRQGRATLSAVMGPKESRI